MIRHADGLTDFAETVSRLNGNNPFACRIVSLFRCYSPALPFVDYWLTADDGGHANGAIARNGTDYILFLTETTDLGEATSFLQMTGAHVVLCDGSFSLTGFKSSCKGVVLQTNQPVVLHRELPAFEPKLRDVYALLCTCKSDSFSLPAWEDFYVDMNHKLRHGTSRLCGVADKKGLAAAGMTVAETEHCAVLSAVACRADVRRQGFGTHIVGTLVNALLSEGKTVYLHRAENENAAFYRSMGFAETGTWKEYTY